MHKRILNNLKEAVLLFNQQLVLTYINSAGEILLADSANHLLGLSAEKLFKTPNKALSNDLRHCLTMDEVLVDRELILFNINNSVTVNFSATPLKKEGEYNEILVELQQVDRQLRISKEEQLLAQCHTNRLLVKGLAHEIKNPLGGIKGAAQLLDLELPSFELKEYTQIIIQEADRLKSLMDKMLGPNKPANKKLLSIHVVLERVRQLVAIEIDHVTIKTDYDPSIPELLVDKNQLIQAVLNIVQNAVQAIPDEGEIILKTRIKRYMTIYRKCHKLTVKIDIIDNGSGISEVLMNQIFYPMVTGRAEGTGLGLSIAQSLINQHNGIIECNSKEGYTVFSIYLPLGECCG